MYEIELQIIGAIRVLLNEAEKQYKSSEKYYMAETEEKSMSAWHKGYRPLKKEVVKRLYINIRHLLSTLYE